MKIKAVGNYWFSFCLCKKMNLYIIENNGCTISFFLFYNIFKHKYEVPYHLSIRIGFKTYMGDLRMLIIMTHVQMQVSSGTGEIIVFYK